MIKPAEGVEMDMGRIYDMNKAIMLTQPIMTAEQWHEISPLIENWFNWKIDTYAMLLCRERNDYTVFALYKSPAQNPNPPAVAVEELQECLANRGDVLSIDKTDDGLAWEIWIRDSGRTTKNADGSYGGECFAYYLFPYDEGVIEV